MTPIFIGSLSIVSSPLPVAFHLWDDLRPGIIYERLLRRARSSLGFLGLGLLTTFFLGGFFLFLFLRFSGFGQFHGAGKEASEQAGAQEVVAGKLPRFHSNREDVMRRAARQGDKPAGKGFGVFGI